MIIIITMIPGISAYLLLRKHSGKDIFMKKCLEPDVREIKTIPHVTIVF